MTVAIARYYANTLDDRKNLEDMASYARSETMKKHTYQKRAEELISLMERLMS